MSEWSDGYVNDIGYTHGYYGELNPESFTIPFLMAGAVAPEVINACELGFGQGISVNMHACASKTKWFGTDFNPAQASYAKELADVSGANIELFDQSFAEFCERSDLPEFDFIGLHGIWSWISHENRTVLVDFIRKKLKVGGVLYISYNTLPGWTVAAPVRHMMTEYSHVMGASGDGSVNRVKKSVDFTKKLFSMCHSYQNASPSVTNKIKHICEQNIHYLAHEYFNRDWNPMYFSELADCLRDAKLDYVCSAAYLDDFKVSNFTMEQQELLAEIPDLYFAEGVKDFMTNKQFRKDYWVKGLRRLNPLQYEQAWLEQSFILMASDIKDIKLELSGAVGTISLSPEVFEPILAIFEDNEVHTVKQVQEKLVKKNISDQQLFEALSILHAQSVLGRIKKTVDKDIVNRCYELNMHILKSSLVNSDVNFLVSPLTGGAVSFGRIDQIFLYAYLKNKSKKDTWVEIVWEALDKLNQRMIKDGKTLETPEENIKELKLYQKRFEKNMLPFAIKMQLIKNSK